MILLALWLALWLAWPMLAGAQTLTIHDHVQTLPSLTNTAVTLTGRAELRITGTGDPLAGCVIHLNSPDSGLLITNILPSTVASTFLSRVRVQGAVAVRDVNVRVTQYAQGAMIVPQGDAFLPLQIFEGRYYMGSSQFLSCFTPYDDAGLGTMAGNLSSFKLKRGYMATFAQQENGAGVSRCYVAQDGDLEVARLPASLDNGTHYVRVFPWRWVSKKGIAGNINSVGAHWWYNWNLDQNSPLNKEYVPIRHRRWWPGLDEDWRVRGSNHVLGYNEPDNAIEANLPVGDAIFSWPDLLAPGLRVGSPAPTDGGLTWLYDFVNQADAGNLRVDFVAVHYYRSYSSASDPVGATNQFKNFLQGVYDNVKRPLWVTEWNNGANWTGGPDPTFAQQADTVGKMIEMLDNTPFVERYALFNWVEDVRRVVWDDPGQPVTSAGAIYRDKISPLAYQQELVDIGSGSSARYSFDGHAHDLGNNGFDAMEIGAPLYQTGRYGQALALDGVSDYLQASPRLADSADWSFAGWIYWNGGGNWQRIFDFGQDLTHFLFLTPKTTDGKMRFTINTGSGEQQLISTAALPTGTWTHVAVTLSGNTGKLFVNGTVVATNTGMTHNPIDVGTKYNFLGKSRFVADPFFNGKFDDFRFVSSALTDAQVLSYATTAPPQFSTQTLWKPSANVGQAYATSLAANVTGGSGALTFDKMEGPAWLTLAANGSASGTPTATDGGVNRFLVRVTDAIGATHTTVLTITVPLMTTSVSDSADDAEESAAGVVSLTSTDLELVNDGAAGNQLVGLRFANLEIPQGSLITNATIQFTTDEIQTEPTALSISMENADHAAAFGANNNNLSARPRSTTSVSWQPAAWNVISEAGGAQRTPNVAGLMQKIIARPGWRAGNALVFFFTGTGHRTADAFNKVGGGPPQLTITYQPSPPVNTLIVTISQSANDAEESSAGVVSLTSTDLELLNDGALGNQVVGLRFENLALPPGAMITSSNLQFASDEAQSEPTAIFLRAQAVDQAPAFTTSNNNLSTRSLTAASVAWEPAAWDNLEERGPLQHTPDLSPLIQEVVSRPGWTQGNALALILTGTGHRTADAADELGGVPALLTVNYRTEAPLGTYQRWADGFTNLGNTTADLDHDGQSNLLEYFLGLDPTKPDPVTIPLTASGSVLLLTYQEFTQATEATGTVEWCDNLSLGPWSNAGVTARILNDNGTFRTIQASVPAGSNGKRFVRLKVSLP